MTGRVLFVAAIGALIPILYAWSGERSLDGPSASVETIHGPHVGYLQQVAPLCQASCFPVVGDHFVVAFVASLHHGRSPSKISPDVPLGIVDPVETHSLGNISHVPVECFKGSEFVGKIHPDIRLVARPSCVIAAVDHPYPHLVGLSSRHPVCYVDRSHDLQSVASAGLDGATFQVTESAILLGRSAVALAAPRKSTLSAPEKDVFSQPNSCHFPEPVASYIDERGHI